MDTHLPATQERIRKPRFRGQLTKLDSAETQLGLLHAGNGEGSIYLLVNPKTSIVEKAKFLSYGRLSSILVFDTFCESIKDRALETYDTINLEELKQTLLSNLEASELPFPEFDFNTLDDILKKLRSSLPNMEVAKPIEGKTGVYKRKAKEDMNEKDLAWLPLSAPEKIAKVEEVMTQVVPERTSYLAEDVELYNIERDLMVYIRFSPKVETQHKLLITQFLHEACQSQCHPEIVISEADS